MRTPDEIKKGLECCADGNVVCTGNCVFDDDVKLGYPDCVKLLMTNAFSYIQQLEAERDAAVALIPRACAYCKWYGTKHGGFHPDCKNPNGCRNVSGINTGWQWRGVQKEDGNEKT